MIRLDWMASDASDRILKKIDPQGDNPMSGEFSAGRSRVEFTDAVFELHPAELMNEVRPLFRQGIVDPFMTTLEHFELEAKRDRASCSGSTPTDFVRSRTQLKAFPTGEDGASLLH